MKKVIKVGGFQWAIEEHADVAHEGNVFGSTHTQTQKIFLEPNLSTQKRQQTILHEVMHAVWWQSGLERIYGEKDYKGVQEAVVHALSMGLYQVIKDNPDLLK